MIAAALMESRTIDPDKELSRLQLSMRISKEFHHSSDLPQTSGHTGGCEKNSGSTTVTMDLNEKQTMTAAPIIPAI